MGNIDQFDGDPSLGDEDSPEYQEEMFEMFRMRGWKPEQIKDPVYADKYAKWLHTTRNS